MQMNEQVLTALEVLRNFAENEFELHRIAALEKDLINPPKVEVIDETHQKFNGITYAKTKDGHHRTTLMLHKAVYLYCCGEIPESYIVHHEDWNPANNEPSNLSLKTPTEHRKIHNTEKPNWNNAKHKICPFCGRGFYTRNDKIIYCSQSCAMKAAHNTKREQRQKETRICKNCGVEFPANQTHNGNFCSVRCNNAYNFKNRMEQRKCVICGETFTVNKYLPTQTCSYACGGKLATSNRITNKLNSVLDVPAR